MFGLFKSKKEKLAEAIYGNFRPGFQVVKKYGKWDNKKSFGEIFITNDYLIGYLNNYINLCGKANGVEGINLGKLAARTYELMDPIFKEFSKLEESMDRYHNLSSKPNKELKLATDESYIFLRSVMSSEISNEILSSKIYKEAAKYYNSGKFDADHQFAKKKMPDDLYDKKFMDNAPAHILIGYRMFEQTFVKRLNKFYKVKF